jgi:uncharacterized protein YcsI (UPF0317 family)
LELADSGCYTGIEKKASFVIPGGIDKKGLTAGLNVFHYTADIMLAPVGLLKHLRIVMLRSSSDETQVISAAALTQTSDGRINCPAKRVYGAQIKNTAQ